MDTIDMLSASVSSSYFNPMEVDVSYMASQSAEMELLFVTENCTNEAEIQEHRNASGLDDWQLNITTEYPLDYAKPLYGYCVPVLFIITIIVNTLIVVVLAKRHMRSPTNTVLMAMALSDMMTIMFPVPFFLYAYTFNNHNKPFYPVSICYAWVYMNEVLPNLFHTASIWLTVLLATQRYIYVCHAPIARTYCTLPRVMKVIVFIFAFAAIHQGSRFVDIRIDSEVSCWEGEVHHVCKKYIADWVQNVVTPNVYFNIYYWFRVLFVHLIPCIVLIALNVLLFEALRKAEIKRERLFNNGNIRVNKRGAECKKMRDSQCTTLMLIVVVTVFLLLEVPLAILTILHIISSSIKEFLDYDLVNVLILFSNFSITASYPINFAIYCGMSKQFRETFKALFIPNEVATSSRRAESSRFSVGNGGAKTFTSETAV